jgi:hypothetical protein
MLTLEDLFDSPSLDRPRLAVVVISGYFRDIQLVMDKMQEVTLPLGIFPFQDFCYDDQLNLYFTPRYSTNVSLSFVSYAAYHCNPDFVSGLLALSVTSKVRDTSALTPLSSSLLANNFNTARFLLSQGADPRGESCTNGLHAAARAGLRDMVSEFIVRYKIPPDCADAQGATPAIYALYLPDKEAICIVSVLFCHGASPKRTFGRHDVTYARLAKVMGKSTLAHWLQQTETDSIGYTIDYLWKQTRDLSLRDGEVKGEGVGEGEGKVKGEGEDAGWDLV